MFSTEPLLSLLHACNAKTAISEAAENCKMNERPFIRIGLKQRNGEDSHTLPENAAILTGSGEDGRLAQLAVHP